MDVKMFLMLIPAENTGSVNIGIWVFSQIKFEEIKEEIGLRLVTKAYPPSETSKGQRDNTNNVTK